MLQCFMRCDRPAAASGDSNERLKTSVLTRISLVASARCLVKRCAEEAALHLA